MLRYILPLVDIFGVVFCNTRLLSVGNTDCGADDKGLNEDELASDTLDGEIDI